MNYRTNTPEEEAAFRRGYDYGRRSAESRLEKRNTRIAVLERELQYSINAMRGVHGSFRHTLSRAQEFIPADKWEYVFGHKKAGQP